MTIDAFIKVDKLYFSYDGTKSVLENITFEAGRNERIGIVGPSGSGKSTLLFAIAGLLPFSRVKGNTFINNEKMMESKAARLRKQIGLVMQNPDDQLIGATVQEDIGLGLFARGFDKNAIFAKVKEQLKGMRISELAQRSPCEISFGEKKRACVAGILAVEPDLLLLDEPGEGLDPRGKRELINIICNNRACMMISGHDMELILNTTEKVIVLDKGEIVAFGLTQEILADEKIMEHHGLMVPPSLRVRHYEKK
ncbi:MAG: energy-coupling factor ABC transporter ATP-binding protein [Candidatus Theseobacter exili]|nr:energy-coupling factor ABC transporter ATP-binding protein [Candidatus Theseobacter exili]